MRAPAPRASRRRPPRPRPSRSPSPRRSSSPIARFIRVSGTLTAEEAGRSGRRDCRPHRGHAGGTRHPRRSGGDLVRIAAAEAEAQARGSAGQRRANRSPARHRQRRSPSTPNAVPEVANAKAAYDLAQADFERVEDAARPEADVAVRVRPAPRPGGIGARGSTRSPATAPSSSTRRCMAARARVAVAQKALADTVVRAPFAGVVGERSCRSATTSRAAPRWPSVVRVDPLRVELTVPEQFVSVVARRPRRWRFRWMPIPARPSPARCATSRRR